MALLDLHVVPSSSRDQIVGRRGLALKVKLRAPAIDGKANASLLVFLATSLDLRARTLVLISGEHAPEKRLALFGITPAELARRIDAALAAKG